MQNVRTRIAPSPTGFMHLGNLRTVLIDYALAKKNNGQFIWRNEDTDQQRFVEDALEFNMKWIREFGLNWDEGPDIGGPYAPYTQTERLPMYTEAAEKLIENGYAYRCFCSKERLDELRKFQQESGQMTRYDGKCKNLTKEEIEENLKNKVPYTIRIKMPRDRIIEFTDAITHNHIKWNSNDVDDYIIMKSNGIPTYHLAAMYDDVVMKISHAFRGSEWLATTPVHIMILEGLGIKEEDRAKIGHFTVILDPNTPGKKFSKRNKGFRINGLLQMGYLKDAVLNYLMLLGWAPKDNRELFTLEEFVQAFDLDGMQKANPTWDQKKMDWFNGVYMRKLDKEGFANALLNWIEKYLLTATEEDLKFDFVSESLNEERVKQLVDFAKSLFDKDKNLLQSQLALVQERAITLWDALVQIEFFYNQPTNIDWKIKQLKNVSEKLDLIKKDIYDLISKYDEDSSNWKHEDWEKGMREIAEKYNAKAGDIFMVLRVALVASPFSPPLFEAMQILGKKETLNRLN